MGELSSRRPNRWGEGGRLRDEIVRAARELLEDAGTEAAVTLRATARKAGISAPAIYAHFAGREAIIDAVVTEAFEEFNGAVALGVSDLVDPGARLRALCLGYLQYAHEHPATYLIIFNRHDPSPLPTVRAAAATAFNELMGAVTATSPDTRLSEYDAFERTVLLWVGLHGLATLPPHHPRFPWPEMSRLLDALLTGYVVSPPPNLTPPRG